MFVGDVTSYTLHNLLPGTTYDVKVFAQYDAGISGALTGQGTTRMCLNVIWFINHIVALMPNQELTEGLFLAVWYSIVNGIVKW